MILSEGLIENPKITEISTSSDKLLESSTVVNNYKDNPVMSLLK